MMDSVGSYRQNEGLKGLAALLAAYSLWGLVVILFKQFSGWASAFDVVAHRAVWSLVLLLPLVLFAGRMRICLTIFSNPKLLGGLVLSSLLISINWLVFVLSIETDRVLESSFGYYINPLVSVLLGVLVLSERLRPVQMISLLLASLSIGAMLWLLRIVPWISLVVAVSFALYGLMHKILAVDHLEGLFIETVLLAPIALAWLVWRALMPGAMGFPAMGDIGWQEWLLLISSGAATVIPLLLFVYGVRRRSLTTVGFTQYITPTGHFLTAVLIYGELFGGWHLLIFSGVWVALGIFLVDLFRHEKQRHRNLRAAASFASENT